jgi:hypothetical protein
MFQNKCKEQTLLLFLIKFDRFLLIPQNVLKNNNCEPADDLNSQNMLFRK